MELDLSNIKEPSFSIESKGFNKEEVISYFNKLFEELTNFQLKIFNLENQVQELKSGIEKYQKRENNIIDLQLSLEDSQKHIITKSKEKVQKLIEQAEEKAREIIFDAEEEAKSSRDILLFLKEQRDILLLRLKIIIDNQEGMLNDLQADKSSDKLIKTLAEAEAFKIKPELNIDTILEKLL